MSHVRHKTYTNAVLNMSTQEQLPQKVLARAKNWRWKLSRVMWPWILIAKKEVSDDHEKKEAVASIFFCKILFKTCLYFILCVGMCLLPVHQCVSGTQGGQKRAPDWNWSYSQLWAATRVLAIEPRRAVNALNHRAVSPATVASVFVQLEFNEGLRENCQSNICPEIENFYF